jgi:uncharacterized protein YjbJ (UPF0337 family)
MTTKQEISGRWKELSGKVKEKYGQITDNDLTQVEGNVDQLVGLVQRKTGQTREQIEAFIEECGESCQSMMKWASSAGESIKDAYQTVSDKTKQSFDSSVKAVSKHPLESVGAAFGIGLFAGVLIGMSMGSQRERDMSWRERWMR